MTTNTQKIAYTQKREVFANSIKNKSSREIFNKISLFPIILLFILNGKENKSISNCSSIAKYMGKSNSPIYNNFSFLKLLGFISSEKTARSKTITITEKGQKFLKDIIKEIGDLELMYL